MKITLKTKYDMRKQAYSKEETFLDIDFFTIECDLIVMTNIKLAQSFRILFDINDTLIEVF